MLSPNFWLLLTTSDYQIPVLLEAIHPISDQNGTMNMIRAVLSLGQNCAPECLSLRFKKRDLTSVATALPEMNRRHLSITEIASHTQS